MALLGFPLIVRSLIAHGLRNGNSSIYSIGDSWIYHAVDEILMALIPLHNHHDLSEDWSMELCRFLEVLDSFYRRSLSESEFLEVLIDSIASSFVANIVNDLNELDSGYPDPREWYDEDFPCEASFCFPWHYAAVA